MKKVYEYYNHNTKKIEHRKAGKFIVGPGVDKYWKSEIVQRMLDQWLKTYK